MRFIPEWIHMTMELFFFFFLKKSLILWTEGDWEQEYGLKKGRISVFM